MARDHPQQAVPGGVEAQRGGQRGAQPAVRPLGLAECLAPVDGQQACDRTVAHHDALGAAGGAGGVDHIGGARRLDPDARGIGGLPGPVALGDVQDHGTGRCRGSAATGGCGETGGGRETQRRRGLGGSGGRGGPGGSREVVDHLRQRPAGTREHRRRTRIGQHPGDPLPGILGIQRQERRTRLQHRELTHHRLHRTRHSQRHHILGTHTTTHQPMRQTIRPNLQLRITQPGLPEHQSRLLRRLRHLRRERHRDERRFGGQRPVAVEEFGALALGQQVGAADPLVGAGGHRRQQAAEAGGDRLDGLAVEQVGGEVDRAVHPGGRSVRAEELLQRHIEVELGDPGVRRQRLGTQPGRLEPGPGVGLKDHRHLEERVAGRGADGVELLDQPLEGQVLVGVGAQAGLPDPV